MKTSTAVKKYSACVHCQKVPIENDNRPVVSAEKDHDAKFVDASSLGEEREELVLVAKQIYKKTHDEKLMMIYVFDTSKIKP